MKKLVLLLPAVALLASMLGGCASKNGWKHEERKAMRKALENYRQMIYLDDLSDLEFAVFADEVANELEMSYPVYTALVAMPQANDSIEVVVVETIVDELNANPHNMRHLFPYPYLVANGILPEGLDHNQLRQFYACLAAKVNQQYLTVEQFFNALLSESADYQQIVAMQSACANDLFGWTMVIEEVVTPAPQP